MQTIEIIGPSGAGKTTYIEDMLNGDSLYTDRLNTFTRSFPGGLIIQKFPLTRLLTGQVFKYVRPRYEQEFISKFPGLLETTAPIIRNYADKRNVLNFILREAAWFEFFSDYLMSDEVYVIDDGLYQFHLRLLPIKGWTAEDIMDRLPVPDKFIFVDAPGEVCLERQESRSRGRASKLEALSESEAINELEIMRSGSEKFIIEARDRGVEVEIVDNT